MSPRLKSSKTKYLISVIVISVVMVLSMILLAQIRFSKHIKDAEKRSLEIQTMEIAQLVKQRLEFTSWQMGQMALDIYNDGGAIESAGYIDSEWVSFAVRIDDAGQIEVFNAFSLDSWHNEEIEEIKNDLLDFSASVRLKAEQLTMDTIDISSILTGYYAPVYVNAYVLPEGNDNLGEKRILILGLVLDEAWFKQYKEYGINLTVPDENSQNDITSQINESDKEMLFFEENGYYSYFLLSGEIGAPVVVQAEFINSGSIFSRFNSWELIFFALVFVLIFTGLSMVVYKRQVLKPLRQLKMALTSGPDSEYMELLTQECQEDELNEIITVLSQNLQKKDNAHSFHFSEEVYKQAMQMSTDGFSIINLDGIICYINPSFSASLGYDANELVGKTVNDIFYNKIDEISFKGRLDVLKMGKSYKKEKTFLRKNQIRSVDEIMVAPFLDSQGKIEHILLFKKNMEEKKKYEELVQYLTHQDSLTGLPNRLFLVNAFNRVVINCKMTGSHCAVFFVNLDRFKMINNIMGHSTGDELLRDVAEKLTDRIKEAVCIARVGGDEYSILLESYDTMEDLENLAKKILDIFNQPFKLKNHYLDVSVSIGSARYPDDGKDINTVIDNAETAMHRAKEMGKNIYLAYEEQMHARLQERLQLEQSLKIAIDNYEFEAFLQPQISTRTKRIVGCEALIRWNASKGIIFPDDFITVADETGLIVPMTRWMLTEACQLNKTLLAEGFDITVAVNIPAQVVQSDAFLGMLEEALKESGLPPENLEVEITEGTIMSNSIQVVSVLEKIKEMGILISLDDFGTGYSSLSYLSKFPISRIKIDRSFVREMPNNPEAWAIVQAVVAMSKGLKILTTAEGVETEEQFDYLKQLGCDEIQGYYISRPIPFAEFKSFLYEYEAWLDDIERED